MKKFTLILPPEEADPSLPPPSKGDSWKLSPPDSPPEPGRLTVSFLPSYLNLHREHLDGRLFNMNAELSFLLSREKRPLGILSLEPHPFPKPHLTFPAFDTVGSALQDSLRRRNTEPLKELLREGRAYFAPLGIDRLFLSWNGRERLCPREASAWKWFFTRSLKRLSYPGLLVVLEGIDGSGKSTQIDLLREALRKRGISVSTAREPSNSLWGKRIREKAKQAGSLSGEEQLRLFLLDRSLHFRQTLLPSLMAGNVVLLDRSYPSTYAYQGATGLSGEEILARNLRICPPPDLMLLYDLPVEAAWERLRGRTLEPLFERVDFLHRVRTLYREIPVPNALLLDATLDPTELARQGERAILASLFSSGSGEEQKG